MIDTVPDEIPENDIPAAPEAVPEETPDSVPAAVPEAVHDEPAVIAEVPAAEPAAAVEVPEAPESTDKLALEVLPYALTVSKVNHIENIDPSNDFFFIARTDNEVSLVCETEKTPFSTAAREDGWKALRVKGVLDFSLTGILSKIAGILAENGIAIFAVSTYDTDYILVKDDKLDKALNVLGEGGYDICR
ncbi:MAG: ACT domain-containing protein [Ruminiclostridium sp.]|nr:ACT domain-containing protein [Ruminiclostridium sp.]